MSSLAVICSKTAQSLSTNSISISQFFSFILIILVGRSRTKLGGGAAAKPNRNPPKHYCIWASWNTASLDLLRCRQPERRQSSLIVTMITSPRLTLPYHATPCLASPRPASPNRAKPSHASPCQAMPNHYVHRTMTVILSVILASSLHTPDQARVEFRIIFKPELAFFYP